MLDLGMLFVSFTEQWTAFHRIKVSKRETPCQRILSLLLCLVSYLVTAPGLSAESFTTNVVDNAYFSGGATYVLGTTGPSNALIIANSGRLDDGVGIVGAAPEASGNLAWVTDPSSYWENSQTLYLGHSSPGNTLVITNGARVYSAVGVVGYNASTSNNTVLVTGTGSRWECPGGLQFGVAGSGNTMRLTGGGQVFCSGFSGFGYLSPSAGNRLLIEGPQSGWFSGNGIAIGSYGSSANECVVSGGGFLSGPVGSIGNGASNSVWLTDAGTSWNISMDLFVGDQGNGNQLTVTNGARASCLSGWIGGNDNVVRVVGLGSFWDTGSTRSQLVVGDGGFGNQLFIEDGGRVLSWDGFVSSSNNSVTISGTGSLWTNVDLLFVGEDFGRSNHLSLTEGGQAASGATLVAGDLGRLRVNGIGSVLRAGAWLSVGHEIGHENLLSIEDGGQVTNYLGYIGGFDEPFDPHGRGFGNSVSVSGAGSAWHNGSNLVVGSVGPGSRLSVSTGGTVNNADGYLGFFGTAANSLVEIRDPGSSWLNRRNLFVGYQSSGNRLVITNGARLRSTGGFVGRQSNRNNTVLVSGPDSRWQLSEGLVVGNSGSHCEVKIANGGTISCASASIDAPTNVSPGASNLVWVAGIGSRLAIAGDLTIGLSAPGNELRVDDGGLVVASRGSAGGGNTFNNRLTVAGGALVVTNASGSGLLSLNRVQMDLLGGSVTLDSLAAGSLAGLRFVGGTLKVNRATAFNTPLPFIVGTGSDVAELELDPGIHSFAVGLIVAEHSVLTAAGTLNGNVSNSGTLSIREGPGSLTVNGSLQLSASSDAFFEIAGPATGTQSDLLRVTNTIALGGTLRVALLGGYVPASNAVIKLIEFGSSTGAFLNAPPGGRLPLGGSETTAQVDYRDATLRLTQFHYASPATNEIDPAWALLYFGHAPLTPEEKEADADGDRLTNEQEFWAGTNPIDATSVLKITAVIRQGASLQIRFQCVEGKSYGLAWSSDLTQWNKVPVNAPVQVAPGICEWIDDGSQTGSLPASSQRFYRVTVR